MANYTEQEEKELNSQLRKWQRRAKRLILNNYYDSVAESINDLNFTALKAVTNAKTYKDINCYLWNSGLIERTLDKIAEKIKTERAESRKGAGYGRGI